MQFPKAHPSIIPAFHHSSQGSEILMYHTSSRLNAYRSVLSNFPDQLSHILHHKLVQIRRFGLQGINPIYQLRSELKKL
jgi:hypothetical protein